MRKRQREFARPGVDAGSLLDAGGIVEIIRKTGAVSFAREHYFDFDVVGDVYQIVAAGALYASVTRADIHVNAVDGHGADDITLGTHGRNHDKNIGSVLHRKGIRRSLTEYRHGTEVGRHSVEIGKVGARVGGAQNDVIDIYPIGNFDVYIAESFAAQLVAFGQCQHQLPYFIFYPFDRIEPFVINFSVNSYGLDVIALFGFQLQFDYILGGEAQRVDIAVRAVPAGSIRDAAGVIAYRQRVHAGAVTDNDVNICPHGDFKGTGGVFPEIFVVACVREILGAVLQPVHRYRRNVLSGVRLYFKP